MVEHFIELPFHSDDRDLRHHTRSPLHRRSGCAPQPQRPAELADDVCQDDFPRGARLRGREERCYEDCHGTFKSSGRDGAGDGQAEGTHEHGLLGRAYG